LQWNEFGECEVIPPTQMIDKTAAQVLMDSLWDCGIRPTAGAGTVGQLSATQEHLRDMKQIAFKLLKM
jgi:hypothetical protein